MKTEQEWTLDKVRALGMTTDVVTAGAILGIGRTTAYRLARTHQFPVPVLRIGKRLVVSIPHLLTALGAEPGQPGAALDGPPSSPVPSSSPVPILDRPGRDGMDTGRPSHPRIHPRR